MKKAVYSVVKVGRFDTPKMTGLGYVADGNLLISAMSQKGKPYIRVFFEKASCLSSFCIAAFASSNFS